MIKNKKGSAWIWILIILIAVGVGLYIWFSGDAGSVANTGISAGSSIPQPPALPTG